MLNQESRPIDDFVQQKGKDLNLLEYGDRYVRPWKFEPPHSKLSKPKVWKSPKLTDFLDKILCRRSFQTTNGDTVTFSDALKAIATKWPVYLAGGIVRDAIVRIEGCDVDFAFEGTGYELKTFAESQNWDPSLGSGQVYIKFPKNNSKESEYLEGMNVEYSIYSPAYAKDFCCNALYYDMHNKVLLDMTGFGKEDAVKRKLTLPRLEGWDFWTYHEPNRFFRFWKFCMRGFYASNYTKDLICEGFIRNLMENSFYSGLGKMAACMRGYLKKVEKGDQLNYKANLKELYCEMQCDLQGTDKHDYYLYQLDYEKTDIWDEIFHDIEITPEELKSFREERLKTWMNMSDQTLDREDEQAEEDLGREDDEIREELKKSTITD